MNYRANGTPNIGRLADNGNETILPGIRHVVPYSDSIIVIIYTSFCNSENFLMRIPAICAFLLLLSPQLFAQTVITGRVTDAETGESLPAANIQIMDTYRGTITNMEGFFELPVETLPVTLIIRYIGYATRNIQVEQASQPVDVLMQPVTIDMDEVVVTGKDPALSIMEKVIVRKQLWRKDLATYTAEAYTRQRLENNDGIVSITESVSRVHWDRDRGTREVLMSRRQTNNLAESRNFAGAGYLPNLYDDDIEIAGYRLVGVTHPDALKFYDFKLEGLRNIDDQVIYDIRVIPKRRLQPVFEGMVSVLAGEYALLEVDLKPGPAVMFPPPVKQVDLHYRQQFSNFGGDAWLPVDMRIEGLIDIGFVGLQIPTIIFAQISGLTDYRINIELPDSLYRVQRLLIVDTLSTRSGKTLEELGQPLPLTMAEKTAYDEVDSTKTLEDAFRPTGFLAGMVTTGDEEPRQRSGLARFGSGFEPVLWYNRVDALHIGGGYESPYWKRMRARVSLGYSTGSEEWGYGAELNYRSSSRGLFGTGRTGFETGYRNNTAAIGETGNYPMAVTGILPLFGARDYYDYFRNEQVWFGMEQRVRSLRSTVRLRVNHEVHSGLEQTTSYSIPGGKKQPENPVIEEATLRSAEIRLSIGDTPVPFGVVGQNNLQLSVEHSDPALFGGDFDFTRYSMTAAIRIPTFYKRRLFPNALDMQLMAGTYSGELPAQRFGTVDGSLGLFRPFGTLRSLTNRPVMAPQYAFLFWEHNFRTIPFEALGMYGVARRGLGLVVHGASGRTWQNGQSGLLRYAGSDGYHHEVGLSLIGIFGILRFDTALRLDEPGFTAGLGITRFF
ncbi:MAG: carboxypeptidase-like regulatory domain-containing protein [Balneolaceae bacterium]|nr:MAG: carboxypeptidase-like regulatory domain-containing protein [Balneolaceae bacterium]